MAKLVRKSAENRDQRQGTCLHGAVKVGWRALQSCWECSSVCYTPIQCQTSTIVASLHLWGTTWWPNVAWKSAENRDQRQGTCLHGAVKVGWRALQSCWECSSICYTHKQCQTSTISKPTSLVIECFYRIVHLHIAYFYEHSYKFDNLAIHLLWSLPSCIEIEPAAKWVRD